MFIIISQKNKELKLFLKIYTKKTTTFRSSKKLFFIIIKILNSY